jgi:hypothetical protein
MKLKYLVLLATTLMAMVGCGVESDSPTNEAHMAVTQSAAISNGDYPTFGSEDRKGRPLTSLEMAQAIAENPQGLRSDGTKSCASCHSDES